MKTFKQLTVGDKVFVAYESSTKYYETLVTQVETHKMYFDSNIFERFETFSCRKKDYHKDKVYFTREPDVIRYCKAQMMKELFALIEAAKKRIKEVKDFRAENFELLNHRWTEIEINKLEKEINQ